MPELPEVQEVRRTLEPFVRNVRIVQVAVFRKSYIRCGRGQLSTLVGRYITRTIRHGKKLFCVFDDGRILLFHLGMSGRITCCKADAPQRAHTHLAMQLATGIAVRMEDPRRFGGVWYYPNWQTAEAAEITGKMGVDALKLKACHFQPWRTMRGRLKTQLLSQRTVAGLGNIYVDESLWMARLHPLQRIHRIKPDRYAQLATAIRSILNKSIAMGGTTLRDYRNAAQQKGNFSASLRVYGRAGLPCVRCGTKLVSKIISGRTTVFCQQCQRRT
ncbi:MAG: bifunctional DNA-formamidopyrimidine glycosylase/DNA-(apurinic or apyrimidinic site) lyase [Phycisphaerae bacterium]